MIDFDDFRFAVNSGYRYVVCDKSTSLIRGYAMTRKTLERDLSKYDNCEVLTLRQYRKKFIEEGGKQ